MQFTVRVKASAKGIIPAVTHVDGTARIQTVTREANPRFYDLLKAFDHLTGVPVLLNTSFNVQEPIVCSPDDAVRCFLRTQVEWLVLGNLLVRLRPNRLFQSMDDEAVRRLVPRFQKPILILLDLLLLGFVLNLTLQPLVEPDFGCIFVLGWTCSPMDGACRTPIPIPIRCRIGDGSSMPG